MDDPLLKTADVAAACRVSLRTAAQWIDRGVLEGWRLPSGTGGAKHRRTTLSRLLAFMRKQGLPDGMLEDAQRRYGARAGVMK